MVLKTPVVSDDVPEGFEVAVFGLGCFWGAEEIFWQVPGVWTTSVGYAGGHTTHPTYEEVCTGRTGHTEAVRMVFDPAVMSFADLLKKFWETHDPTQGFRQGNDVGTQYRSALYYTPTSRGDGARADQGRDELPAAGSATITTEIRPARDVLLRRGVPPAVPREDSVRLRLPRQHRSPLPRIA